MTGFLPDSAYTMVLSQSNSPAVPPAGGISFQVQTDGQGAATMRVLDVVEEFVLYFSVTVDGVTSPWAAVAC